MTDDELIMLTWRYAAMIGIIAPDDRYSSEEEVNNDRERWPDLVVVENGDPVFDFDKCGAWMVEQSGEPLERCRKTLFAEWGDKE